jgi:8-oxo-dGTP pyrophosphatase MutT (NUDIX family)
VPALNNPLEQIAGWGRAASRTASRSGHVAAVCYRVRHGRIEFLLVKSRAGRWTFPKGKVSGDRTRADAAAREAYEEAGVVGRVETRPFASYIHKKRSILPGGHSEHFVDAHLCEVRKVDTPLESFRDPTWFSVQISKRRLLKKRESRHAKELARIVDQASAAICERHRIRHRIH